MVGASTDDIATLARFQKEDAVPQRFVSDPEETLTKAFGVGLDLPDAHLAGRVTFVIGTDGRIAYVVDDEIPQSNVAKTFAWVRQHPVKKRDP